MNTELDVLDQIESNSGSGFKSNLLKASATNIKFQQLLDAAFNFKRKFFIKKFDMPIAIFNNNDEHYNFIKLLNLLESGSHRGDSAKSAVEVFFGTLSDQQQKWYSRIIKKDLKAGFSIDTAIKCGFKIPTFDVMLAKDGKKTTDLAAFISKGGYTSRKLDGYRCVAFVEDGEVTLYSRNGTEYTNFPSIEEALKANLPTGKYILDGEIMSDNFQSMQKSAFAEKRGTTVGDVKYHVFDTIDYNEWISEGFKEVKSVRYDKLKLLLTTISSDKVVLVEHTLVKSLKTLQELEAQYISEKFEGAMFVPNIPYYFGKKSNKMIKMKTMESEDVTVIGFESGEEGSRLDNTLGALLVKQEDGNKCKVGTGFSDDERDYIFTHQNEFLGRKLECQFQEKSTDGIMRFPVFKTWRFDK